MVLGDLLTTPFNLPIIAYFLPLPSWQGCRRDGRQMATAEHLHRPKNSQLAVSDHHHLHCSFPATCSDNRLLTIIGVFMTGHDAVPEMY